MAYSPKEFSRQLVDLGISRAFASQLATGRRTPSMSLAMSICDRLEISLDVWRDVQNHSQALAADDANVNGNLSANFPDAVQS
jgi:transcriptional regulator with XRE-family HTH domain